MPSDHPRSAPDESLISAAAPLYLSSRYSDVFAALGGFGRVVPEVRLTENALRFLMGLRVQLLYIETHLCLLQLLKGVPSSSTHLISSLLDVLRRAPFIARTISGSVLPLASGSFTFSSVVIFSSVGTCADRVGQRKSHLLCAPLCSRLRTAR
jgi:hypothetical protein